MSDITSTAAVDVRNRHESNLLGKLIFTIGGSSITALNVIFIRLTAGSVVVSA
uniref:Uncharacterized protein n=1 Tax=Ciona savignyi TaxID=51511 RepID=H2YEQ3_CIOSA